MHKSGYFKNGSKLNAIMLQSTWNYNPFGSAMPTRNWSDPNSKYKYGLNGKEKDNDINVDGGSYDFGARIYDTRICRWLSMDPMFDEFVDESPYNFCYGNPVIFVDEDGERGIVGMIKAALSEYTGQMVSNLVQGKGFYQSFIGDIDGADVLMSTLQGAFDPTAGSKRWVKIGAKLINLALEYGKASVDYKGDGTYKNAFNGTKSWTETNATFAIALGVNYAGSKITNKITKTKIAKNTECNQYSALAKHYAKQTARAIANKRPKANIEGKAMAAAVNQLKYLKAADKIANQVKTIASPITNTVQNLLVSTAFPDKNENPNSNTNTNTTSNSSISNAGLYPPEPAGSGGYYLNPMHTQIYDPITQCIYKKEGTKLKLEKTHARIDVSKKILIKKN